MKTTTAFTIYDAAAGAGKTHTLVKNYLVKILGSTNKNRYKQILAITFTNKAVSEMKNRILESLYGFSQPEIRASHQHMFTEIQEVLNLSKEDLRYKSKLVLHYLLHNYTAFSVQTIDKFTQSVIRTFAYDLGLATNFEVELDQRKLLERAVDNILAQVGVNDQLSKVVIDFAKININDDKAWNIKKSLLETSSIIFNEDDVAYIQKMNKYSVPDFEKLNKELRERQTSNKKNIIKLSQEILAIFKERGVENEFSRNYIPKYFERLIEKGEDTFDSKWKNEIETTAFYTKKATNDVKQIIDDLRPQIVSVFLQTKKQVIENQFLERILKNVTQMSLLKSINDQLELLKKDDQLLLISDFNKLIFETIKDQPTPFIYERLGERYKDFFVDEFQDTSVMQWQNLLPLCDNAVSSLLENENETGTVTLVGDAKQAIYRWRGGKAEQFMELSTKKSPFSNPSKQQIQLDTNYRSYSVIVEFNNDFFTFLAGEFNNEAHIELYKKGNHQKINAQQGGYVEFNFIEATNAEEKNEQYPEKVAQNIEQIIQNGFDYKDICILVRRNQEGVVIAEYLNKIKIPVLSFEALLIKNSNEVTLLISFIEYVEYSNDKRKKLEFIKALSVVLNVENKHSFISQYINLPQASIEELLLTLDIKINFSWFDTLPIYEAFEELVRGFKFNNTSSTNLQFFMDFVFEYSQKNNSGITSFINFWEQKRDKLSIVVPEGNNAVQIMSIHKAKGLEFPVVIYPFADTEIYKKPPNNVWFPIDDYSELFSFGYVSYNKKVFAQFSDETKLLNEELKELQELDNFNILYVALTRAREQLYVISNSKMNSKKELPEGSFQSYFETFFQRLDTFTNNETCYFIGEPNRKSVSKNVKSLKNDISFITADKKISGVKTVISAKGLSKEQNESVNWGLLIHDVMSKIYDRNDADKVIAQFKKKGKVSADKFEVLKKSIFKIINSKKLNSFFDSKNQIYNEREFVFGNEVLRPDRIEILTDKTVVVIDYKTGEENGDDIHQIHKYAKIFEDLGFLTVRKMLIYVNTVVKILEI